MAHGRRRRRVIWAAGTVVLAGMVTAGVAAGDMHGGLPARMLSGHGMGGAVDFAENGGRVWAIRVAAHGSGSVLELNASNGRWNRSFSGGRYGFRYPGAIAAAGGRIWVAIANQGSYDGGGWVTELNASDGSWIRTLSGPRYGFDGPSAIAAAGHHIWVANPYSSGDGGSGSVTELNASDGSWVQTLSGGCYNFDSPAAIAVAGNHVWVANSHIDQTGGSVTELNASDGSWIRTLSNNRWPRTLLHGCVFGILSGGSYRFINPSVIAAVGSHVWIPDGRTSITVLTDR